MKSTESKLDQVFHPVEHAILSSWLDIEPPPFARDVDLECESTGLPAGAIGLEKDNCGGLDELAIPNAVARIVLSTVQHRLPQWACFKEGQVLFAREPFDRHRGKVSVLPQFLFLINWATSGPGFSWPVAYHVGYLPYYDVHVVTSSADSPDAFGYLDLALGHFPADEDIAAGALRVIRADWQHQHDEYSQQHWEELWETGLLSTVQVEAIADEVWGENTQEEFYAGF